MSLTRQVLGTVCQLGLERAIGRTVFSGPLRKSEPGKTQWGPSVWPVSPPCWVWVEGVCVGERNLQ